MQHLNTTRIDVTQRAHVHDYALQFRFTFRILIIQKMTFFCQLFFKFDDLLRTYFYQRVYSRFKMIIIGKIQSSAIMKYFYSGYFYRLEKQKKQSHVLSIITILLLFYSVYLFYLLTRLTALYLFKFKYRSVCGM